VPFEEERWKAGTEEQVQSDCVRGAMLQDLLADGKLEGLTRQEVREMLDSPDYLGPGLDRRIEELDAPDTAIAEASVWYYYLGFCSGFQMDPDFLAVEFGDDGTVHRWHIRST
jgi:hypothetical protein